MRNLFRKPPNYLAIEPDSPARDIPENLWVRCLRCGEVLYVKEFEKNLQVCHKCDHHFRLSAADRIALLIDGDTFVEKDADLLPGDPLHFVSLDQPYPAKISEAQRKSGLREAVVSGSGRLEGIPVQIAVCDFSFLGASMGSVFGEKVARTIERGLGAREAVLISICSGGARMHEGIFSLMQMPKTAAALARLAEAGVPFVSLLTDPTTGGVSASFATLGDVIIAEPGALVGFAGPRVIEQITKQKLPPGFQRAEFLLEHGMIDMVLHRRDLKSTIGRLLRLYARTEDSGLGTESQADTRQPSAVSHQQPAPRTQNLAEPTAAPGTQHSAPGTPHPTTQSSALSPQSSLSPWERLTLARHPDRPHTLDYVKLALSDFVELRGDRLFGDDQAMVGGIARLGGETVMVIGHQKGRDTRENVARHFGMPRPEGYRKALRLMRQAERFGLPIVTFIDTPGADPGVQSEERGQAHAIAANLLEMSRLRTPMISMVIGEGGSGGAIAIGVTDRISMMENAVYSVVSPEGCAAILWKDAAQAPRAAESMRITAQDLLELGIVDSIVPEPAGGAHLDPQAAAAQVQDLLIHHLAELRALYGFGSKLDAQKLLEDRWLRFRRIGVLG